MAEPAIVAVANPRAANGRARRRALRLQKYLTDAYLDCTLRFTHAPGDATRLTREALRKGTRTILAVGGDGTLNEVVNGFFDGGEPVSEEASLAIAPVGTGTDFARTVGQTADLDEVARRLREGRPKRIDVGLAEFADLEGRPGSRYFVNIAEFGSGGAVVEKVNRTTKVLGGRMSFLLAILSVMPKYRNKGFAFRLDEGAAGEGVANNFIVANGRYFGGGLLPAPHAELDDGLLDVVIIGDVDWAFVKKHLKDLRNGTHLGLPGVTSHRTRGLRTESKERALLDLDGELVGSNPTRFTIVPAAIPLLM